MRVSPAARGPWVVICNTVGVPHTVFDRLLATLAGAFPALCWSTMLTEDDAPHGRPLTVTVEQQTAQVARGLRRLGVEEFIGVSWCSGTEILHRLSRDDSFRVLGHCCINGAFNLGPAGPCSEWENTVEPVFTMLSARPEVLPGVSGLLQAAAAAATEGGNPALAFPYSTPERVVGYAAQCLEMKRARTLEAVIRSGRPGLYLSGSMDKVQAPAISRRAAELAAGTFELVDGGSHAMMADSQRVCDRVRRYCEAI